MNVHGGLMPLDRQVSSLLPAFPSIVASLGLPAADTDGSRAGVLASVILASDRLGDGDIDDLALLVVGPSACLEIVSAAMSSGLSGGWVSRLSGALEKSPAPHRSGAMTPVWARMVVSAVIARSSADG